MKHLAFILIFTISISSLSAQNSPKKSRKERKVLKAQIDAVIKKKVNNLLRTKTFAFYPTYMFPRGDGGVAMGYDYYVKLNNDTIISYLPFLGTTYLVNTGYENSGYDFTERFENYKIGRVRRGYRVSFNVRNGSHSMNFTFYISYLGATTLTIGSNKRQSMSYFGAVSEIKEEEKVTF